MLDRSHKPTSHVTLLFFLWLFLKRERQREREKEKRTNIWLFLDVDGKFYVEKCCVKWAYQFACNWLKLPFLLAISSPIAANGIVMCFCFGFAQKVRIRTIYSCTFWNSMLFCGHKKMVYAQRRRMRRSTLGWFPCVITIFQFGQYHSCTFRIENALLRLIESTYTHKNMIFSLVF